MPRSFQSSGGGTFGLTSQSRFDPSYISANAANFGTPWFGLGISTVNRYSTADDTLGFEVQLPLTLTGSSGTQWTVGNSTSVNLQGSPATPNVFVIGTRSEVFTNGLTAPGAYLFGDYVTTDLGGSFTEAYGTYSIARIGNNSGAANKLVGVYGQVGVSYGGVAQEAIGGEFHLTSTSSFAANVPLVMGLQVRTTFYNALTIADFRGLSLDEWTIPGAGTSITNSYGIYADSTIDKGTSSRYFIYSLSTSPSFFTGKHTFDTTNTAGGTTGNQTIDKPAFSVNFAAGASSLVVTNSFITANSYVLCVVQTNDSTATIKNVVPAAGSVTIRLNAAATAETRVACVVIN